MLSTRRVLESMIRGSTFWILPKVWVGAWPKRASKNYKWNDSSQGLLRKEPSFESTYVYIHMYIHIFMIYIIHIIFIQVIYNICMHIHIYTQIPLCMHIIHLHLIKL